MEADTPLSADFLFRGAFYAAEQAGTLNGQHHDCSCMVGVIGPNEVS